MARIKIASIKPRLMNLARYQAAVEVGLREEGKEIAKFLRKPTRTWRKPKPSFKTTFSRRSAFDASVRVVTSDKRYVNLDRGTKKRWAVMSTGFSPKTTSNSLSSRRGSGKAVIRGRRAMQARGIRPMPGIRPRKFTTEVRKQRIAPFIKRMERSFGWAADGTF